jgi:hypothetical protein
VEPHFSVTARGSARPGEGDLGRCLKECSIVLSPWLADEPSERTRERTRSISWGLTLL